MGSCNLVFLLSYALIFGTSMLIGVIIGIPLLTKWNSDYLILSNNGIDVLSFINLFLVGMLFTYMFMKFKNI